MEKSHREKWHMQHMWLGILALGLILGDSPGRVGAELADAAPGVTQGAGQGIDKSWTHPLLPGLYGRDLNERHWPRTLHDGLASGFSPLCLGMDQSPRLWNQTSLGGVAQWMKVLDDGSGILVQDTQLRRINLAGKLIWAVPTTGALVHCGPLRSAEGHAASRPDSVVLAAGPRLIVIDLADGHTVWRHAFTPEHVDVRAAVADILPEEPGWEVAVVLAHGEEGALIQFPPQGDPRIVWQRPIVVSGEYPERHDHGCDVRIDLRDRQRPLIWNVRRYRCRAIDARTGDIVRSLSYSIGGEPRRNYGPWEVGTGRSGEPIICVMAERVQVHVHGLRAVQDGRLELAWQHFYGEVYKDAPGVALQMLAIADLDQDGVTEMAYSVRDPAKDLRSYVRIRDAESGSIEWELPDHWGIVACARFGVDERGLILACPDPHRSMAQAGDLVTYWSNDSGDWRAAGILERGELWQLAETIPRTNARDLLIRQRMSGSKHRLSRWTLNGGQFTEQGETSEGPLCESPIMGIARSDASIPLYLHRGTDGDLQARTWSGETVWSIPLTGGAYPSLSAADMDGDGRAELVAVGNGSVYVGSFNDLGQIEQHRMGEYVARWETHSGLIYDVEQTGRPCVIAPGVAEDGRLIVRAQRADGTTAWESPPLDLPARGLDSFVAHGGQFLPGPRPAVLISARDDRLTKEGSYLLDGRTGNVVWFKGLHRDGQIVMPVRAHGIPTAANVDVDPCDEIGIDMLSYMAYLNGEDGSFALLHPSANVRAQGGLYAGHLYNTFTPLMREPGIVRPHWFAKGGYGPFGVLNPDLVSGLWKTSLDYDVPPNIGLVDVDGDGELEAGYAALHSRTFVCRDVWTGRTEWEVALPHAPNAPCLSCDADGDGRGEFLIGPFCIGMGPNRTTGDIRWQAPIDIGWGVIADFDGDGRGEIACPQAGGMGVLRGTLGTRVME